MSAHLTLVTVLWTTASAALVCQLRCWQPGGRFNPTEGPTEREALLLTTTTTTERD